MFRFLLPLLACSILCGQTPQINAGGVTGAGLSSPAVTSVAPNGIVSIFGTGFAPAGTVRDAGASDIQNGQLPFSLSGVCVQFGSMRAAMINLRDSQINAVVPAVGTGSVGVQVIANCGGASPAASNTVQVTAQAAAPEFFYFNHNPAGMNQIAGADATTGVAGSVGLIAGATFAPASPGDIVTLYATGLGATQPAIAPGMLATSVAQITAPIAMTIGGETIPVLLSIQYAGVSPTFSGLYQINVLLPSDLPNGLLPVTLSVGGINAPVSALAVFGGACTPPTIYSFSAFPNQSTAPGTGYGELVTDSADSVNITQVGSGLQPGSSATLQVKASTTLTLTAESVCGAATQNLLIAVGAPAIQSATPLTGNGLAGLRRSRRFDQYDVQQPRRSFHHYGGRLPRGVGLERGGDPVGRRRGWAVCSCAFRCWRI